jgi:hypothetical protein
MVIGKIGSLATTILVIGLGFLFLKQAYGSSIGQAGTDVGSGLTSTATGISNVISAFITPITGIFGAISGFLGNFGSNGSRNEPSIVGRDERQTPTRMVKSSDVSVVTQGGSNISSTRGTYAGGSIPGSVGQSVSWGG